MNALPDLTAAVPQPDGRELAVTGGLSGVSLLSSFVAMAAQFPMQGAIAVAGVLVSGAIQIVRMATDNRLAKLTSDNLHLQAAARAADAREASHLARIRDLVAQVDAAHAARDRLATALIGHAEALSPDARRAIVEASAPAHPTPAVPCPPPEPVDLLLTPDPDA